jgi:hypothetical protein
MRMFRFPLTAVREVKILKKLTHVNMVALKEVITSRGSQRIFDDDDDEEETAKRKRVCVSELRLNCLHFFFRRLL